MLRKLYKFLKKIIISFFILYGYDRLVPTKVIIPINIITVLLTTFFNVPIIVALIIIKLIFY